MHKALWFFVEKQKSAPSQRNKGTDSWHVSEMRAKIATH